MKFDKQKIRKIFRGKCAIKGIKSEGMRQIFPSDLFETLEPYWERELGRLINPAPDIKTVLDDLKKALEFLA